MRYLLALLLVSCASSEVEMDELVQAWVGHDLEEIVASWGPPSFDTDLESGEKIYTWRHTGSYTAPNHTSLSGQGVSVGTVTGGGGADPVAHGGNTFTYWCDKSFTVNVEGRLTMGSWRGNACN